MAESTQSRLQKAAEAVATSKSAEEKIGALIGAFEVFNQETVRLEAGYAELKNQYRSVNKELEESNRQLTFKIQELDVITHYLDSILTNMSQGILFIDIMGDVITYNSAAEAILGADRKKVLFQPFWDSFADDEFGFSMSHALRVKNAPPSLMHTITAGGGRRRELEIDTAFVSQRRERNAEKELSPILESMKGLIVMLRDITDLRRLQQIATRNDRLKELGEMASRVAHEIRNPLGGIKGFASLLQRDLADRPEQQKMAQYIVEGTNALNNLVTNVLNYSKPIEMCYEKVDLVTLLQDVRDHIQADNILTTTHTISFDRRKDGVSATCDPAQLKRALLNLLLNAVQATPEGGEIKIALEQRSDEALISVTDRGTGIAAEDLEKIFTPFFTTKAEGHGFGLTEVHKIIQAHGGTIEVTSKPHQGSTFVIHLPCHLVEKR